MPRRETRQRRAAPERQQSPANRIGMRRGLVGLRRTPREHAPPPGVTTGPLSGRGICLLVVVDAAERQFYAERRRRVVVLETRECVTKVLDFGTARATDGDDAVAVA